MVQQERGALALGIGGVYIAFGGLYGDCGSYHGYVVGVPLFGGPMLVYRTPVAFAAGIWNPAGPALGMTGNVYVVTGNGSATRSFGYSNSVIELTPNLQVSSFFAPANWQALDAGDVDLGSVGATLLQGLGVVVAIGKQGVAYLLRADQLGGVGGQIASRAVCAGAWGGTAWLGPMVWVPCSDGLVALSVTQGSISVAWRAAPRTASPIIAAGAVWAIDAAAGLLYALDITSGAVLYARPALQHAGRQRGVHRRPSRYSRRGLLGRRLTQKSPALRALPPPSRVPPPTRAPNRGPIYARTSGVGTLAVKTTFLALDAAQKVRHLDRDLGGFRALVVLRP